MRPRTWIVVTTCCLLAHSLGAQDTVTTARLTGRVVTPRGLPIELVEITVFDVNRSATTKGDGTFRIDGVAEGAYMIRARRLGYSPMTASARVDHGTTVHLSFELVPLPHTLEPVLVSANSGYQDDARWRAFQNRKRWRQSEPSSFATREELAKYGTTPLARIIAFLNPRFVGRDAERYTQNTYPLYGTMKQQAATKMNELVADPAGPRICVIENGVASTGGTTLSDYPASRIEAVEMYPPGSRMPPDLGMLQPVGDRGCNAVVVVWLK